MSLITDRPVMLEMDKVALSFRAGKSSFDHGVHHVLKGVSFKLYENETLGIIGRNGVGKTTMLRIMAGILKPTSGRVTRVSTTTFPRQVRRAISHPKAKPKGRIRTVLDRATSRESRSVVSRSRSIRGSPGMPPEGPRRSG